MEGVLVLNARQNGAKCKAIKHKNTLKWYKQNPFKTWNTWLKRTKYPLKCRFLGAKSAYFSMKNNELTTKLERQNGAKCKFSS